MPPNKADYKPEQGINRRMILRRSAIAVGGLSLGAVGTASADDEPTKFTLDLSGICIHPEVTCLDETVCSVDPSKTHWTVHVHSDGGGGFHVNTHSYRQLIIEGQESGTKWSGTGAKSFNWNARGPFPQTRHFENRLVATSKETTTKLETTNHVFLSINANGELTADEYDVSIGCHAETQ